MALRKERCAVSFVLLFGLEVDSLIHLSPQQVGLLVSRHTPLFILSFALGSRYNFERLCRYAWLYES
jgi:hypothetical protein